MRSPIPPSLWRGVAALGLALGCLGCPSAVPQLASVAIVADGSVSDDAGQRALLGGLASELVTLEELDVIGIPGAPGRSAGWRVEEIVETLSAADGPAARIDLAAAAGLTHLLLVGGDEGAEPDRDGAARRYGLALIAVGDGRRLWEGTVDSEPVALVAVGDAVARTMRRRRHPGAATEMAARREAAALEWNGWGALARNRAEEAAARFMAALQLDPGRARAHMGIAEAAWVAGAAEQAPAHAWRAVATSPRVSRFEDAAIDAERRVGELLLALAEGQDVPYRGLLEGDWPTRDTRPETPQLAPPPEPEAAAAAEPAESAEREDEGDRARRRERALRAAARLDAVVQATRERRPKEAVAALGRAAVAWELAGRVGEARLRIHDGLRLSEALGAADAHLGAELVDALAELEASQPRPRPTPIEGALRAGGARLDALVTADALDAEDCAGATLLHAAATTGKAGLVTRLLRLGARGDAPDLLGRSPILRAAWRGHLEVLAAFDPKPADLETRDVHGRTPLHIAAALGEPEVARWLLRRGARPDAVDGDHARPLHAAAAGDRADVVDTLIAAGATAGAPDRHGQTALHIAARRGASVAAERLVALGAPLDLADADGDRPIHLAARAGHLQLITTLAQAGAALDAPNAGGETALYAATARGDLAVTAALLDLGAAPDARATSDGTALFAAASAGHAHLIALLADAGADLGARDESGATALHIAVRAGHADAIDALLEAGASIEVRDARGESPLTLAVASGDPELVRALLFRPAPLRGPSGLGRVRTRDVARSVLVEGLLRAAAADAPPEVFDALLFDDLPIDAADAEGTTALMAAAGAGARRAFELLLARGAAYDAVDAAGRSALMIAARRGDVVLLHSLAEVGADLDLADGDGLTALHYAGLADKPAAVAALAAAGARVGTADRWGATPAHYALHHGRTELGAELVAAGTPVDLWLAAGLGLEPAVRAALGAAPPLVDAVGPTGSRPLHLAAINDQLAMVRLLVAAGADLEAPVMGGHPDLPARFAGATAVTLSRERVADELVAAGARRIVRGTGVGGPAMDERPAESPPTEATAPDATPRAGALSSASDTLAVQLRERLVDVDVLAWEEHDAPIRQHRADAGWDELIRGCVAAGDLAAAQREAVDHLALREHLVGAGAPGAALARHNAGRLTQLLGDHEAAEPLLLVAREELRPLPLAQSAATEHLGDLYASLGRYDEAQPLIEEALATRRADSRAPSSWVALSLSRLANLLTDRGHYDRAHETFEELLDLRLEDHDEDEEPVLVTRNNFGVLLDRLGDWAAAVAQYEAMLAATTASSEHGLRAVALNNVAYARLRAELAEEARALAAEAVAVLDAGAWADAPHFARGRALLTLAMAEIALDAGEDALATLLRAEEELIAAYGPANALRSDALRRRAELIAAGGAFDEALDLLLEALAVTRLTDAPELTWRVEHALARLLAGAGRAREAIALGKLAVNTLQALRARVEGLAPSLQRSFMAERLAPYRELAGWLVDEGRVIEAQLVLDMLKDEEHFAFTRQAHAAKPAPLLASEAGAASAVEAKNALERRLAVEDFVDDFKDTVMRSLLEVSRDQRLVRRVLEARLAQLDLDRLDDLRAFLREPRVRAHDPALLHLFLAEDRVRVLLTLPDDEEATPFESPIRVRDLYRTVMRLRELLQDPRSEPEVLARRLYDALIAPARDKLEAAGVRTLMVWLDGALRYVPLAALHDGERYLAESFAIALYTPVTHSALLAPAGDGWRVAGLGMSQATPDFEALPAVQEELDAIVARLDQPGNAGAMPGVMHLDGAFTRDSLQAALSDPEVRAVHIASHYRFFPEGERGSYLLLGDGGHLHLGDLRAIRRDGRLRLLALSACNTAVGLGAMEHARSSNDPLGLEVEGLADVTQRNLASSVLASLWPVNDRSTAAMMRRLYGTLVASPEVSKASALQRAQRAFIAGEAGEAWRHPYFWAPFVLMGSWL